MVENCLGTLKICGGNETHKALSGDSGGPMLINRNDQWYQIGVSVKGGRYDERTRVSSFCNFIEEVTNNETQCESIFSAQNNTQMMPIKHFEPIYKGQETPSKLFDFVIPLYNYYYQQCCTATVISKRHLLTSGWCVYHNVESERLTNNSTYRLIYGNFFPDFRLKNVHLSFIEPVNVTGYFPFNYRWTGEHNLAVIEFTEGTDFGIEPVTLAKDYLQVYLEPLIVAGYGKYEFKDNMHIDGTPPKLRHTNAPFHIDTYTDINAILENKFFTQDEGGPALVERNGKFYQAAVNFYYGTANGYRVIVSSHCKFIEEVTKNEVKCESVAPIYEQPFESTTKNQEEDKISVNQKSPSDA
uniref:Peptidase S1 domain-containing protein n=1 Tax=Panagrolaimus sp. ES5 TaxID=591445 RepID=A0AC34FMS7_9BILA